MARRRAPLCPQVSHSLSGGIVSATRLTTSARGWLRIILATLAAFALAYTMAPTQALAAGETARSVAPSPDRTSRRWGSPASASTSIPQTGAPIPPGVSPRPEPAAFTASPGPNGTYRLSAAPGNAAGQDADYYLNTYRAVSGSTTEYSSSATISVADGAVTGQDIALVAGAVISGHLTAGGSALPWQTTGPRSRPCSSRREAGSSQPGGASTRRLAAIGW